MSEKILVPVLGESISEATVSKWLKNEGDTVEADEPIVELETDKVNLEVPSPVSGKLTKINSKDGSIVEVGALLGSVSENGSSLKKTNEIKKIQPTDNKDNVIKLETQKDQEEPKIFEEKIEEQQTEEQPLVLTKEIKEELAENQMGHEQTLSPAVRKIVNENKIDSLSYFFNEISDRVSDTNVWQIYLAAMFSINDNYDEYSKSINFLIREAEKKISSHLNLPLI
mgnify:CR=1 FL=1